MQITDIFTDSRKEGRFEELALETFFFQAAHCGVYREYLEALEISPSEVRSVEQIPFLPIRFFKSREVVSPGEGRQEVRLVFTSSATTGMVPSRHCLLDPDLYRESFTQGYRHFFGDPAGTAVLALLPSYLEREGSSLIYMTEHLIRLSGRPESGFYLYDHARLRDTLAGLQRDKVRTVLFGVTFALLDFAAEWSLPPDPAWDFTVLETGGMKGRGRELPREEIHRRLTASLGVPRIGSEYGMCELLSQAYSEGEGLFRCPPWMQVRVRDLYNPFRTVAPGERGGINVIDLANRYSCSFVETEDAGRRWADGTFSVDGRIRNAELRGCNLLI